MTVKPADTKRGATLCHVDDVRGCPCKSKTAGPVPPWRTKMEESARSTRSDVNPSNIPLDCPPISGSCDYAVSLDPGADLSRVCRTEGGVDSLA
jgi:hypothetical protein